jgi:ParB-like chromosome segregation protein Spo0J
MPRDEAGAIGEVGWRPTAVHPLAALFPMMAEDELAELAEDILTNGLMHPIVVDADGVLIDGRNRLAACEKAGVAPVYQELNGHDAAAFIVSANLARRNLSKGQQAMALAMIYPEPGTRGVRAC